MDRVFGTNEKYFRTIEEKDLDMLRVHRNDFSTWRSLTSPWPIYDQKEWFDNLGKKDLYFIARMKTPEVNFFHDVGLLRIHDILWTNRSCAIGIDVFQHYRGKGIGKEFFALLVKYCFDILNMNRLWLLHVEDNQAAHHIYELNGFKVEGRQREAIFRDGVYKDYIMMSLLRREWEY